MLDIFKMKQNRIELIIVFKKEIELQNARQILDNAGVEYRKGMDSSKGKVYFYNTGPKFIVSFKTEKAKNDFRSMSENLSEVHEIYSPDWSIRKD